MYRKNAFALLVLAVLAAQSPVFAQQEDIESDALSLESAPVEADKAVPRDYKFFVEGALGVVDMRYGEGLKSSHRLSADLYYATKLGDNARFVFSDRLDHFQPVMFGPESTINSLRELYLSFKPWQEGTTFEFGRINLRYGTAYGFNPTDFFRDGALRTITTANPFVLRENRLGTVMVRAQQLWSAGSISLAYAPKITNERSLDSYSADLGATNNRERWLLAGSLKFSERVNAQLLAYKEPDTDTAIGANMTALLSNAIVAHGEWVRARELSLYDRTFRLGTEKIVRDRFVGGLTYTTSTRLSLTAEYQYNGFAMTGNQWNMLSGQSLAAAGSYLLQAQIRQDLAARHAYLVYVRQQDAGLKNLDVTAMYRHNLEDSSAMTWLEVRYRWPKFDLAGQAQVNSGNPQSTFGMLRDRSALQILGTYYF